MMRDFLQSKEWRNFQESFGRKTFFVESKNSSASIIEHELPVVGKYFYVPRGILFCHPERTLSERSESNGESKDLQDKKTDSSVPHAGLGMTIKGVVELARQNNSRWIRLDISDEETLKLIRKNTDLKIVKAPHDMQPREVFLIDIAKNEEDILSDMKPKTRYNIRLAEKKGVDIRKGREYLDDFLRLTKAMARRQGITPHPDEYYRKMLEAIPEDILKLYVAKYQDKTIAADLVVFFEKTATYLHGASDDNFRNVMAPHLLKWREILEAKELGCEKFDFGGISRSGPTATKWAGITKFKLGFSTKSNPTEFLGSWDIIANPLKYWLYRRIQGIKALIK
ncbi:MAG: lipid II:glycine glycyltransferase FemX [Patescibacteria group bacterium]